MKKISLFLLLFLTGCGINLTDSKEGFLVSENSMVQLYDKEFKQAMELPRGTKVMVESKEIKSTDKIYFEIKAENKIYYSLKENVSYNSNDIVKEKKMYVRTPASLTDAEGHIIGLINKGDEINILGYDKLEKGSVNKYKILVNEKEAYIYGKYLVNKKEDSILNYDPEGTFITHSKRQNTQGGGSASNLDFFPRVKAKFENNLMPTEVRSLYINASAVRRIDEYITFAKENNINALVIDIKDNTMPGYKSEVMKKYSITSFDRAISSEESYTEYIKKAKDAGLYVIGRITVFKDSYFVKDNPNSAIMNKETNTPLTHNGSNWPSAFNRLVWEYNIELAKEAVLKMGFNEIQFDYVRFPDRTKGLEDAGKIDMINTYGEDKAVAIQRFLMHATDEINSLNAYVSADVFGESAHPYVTGYGQYFGAISNVVDVISPMPYPDHFGKYEYDFTVPVWSVPYEVLKEWGEYVNNRQKEIPTPAIVRSWFQAYDTIREPYIVYDAAKVEEQIRAFYEMGLTGGYMPWSASSSIERYTMYKDVFKKDLIGE